MIFNTLIKKLPNTVSSFLSEYQFLFFTSDVYKKYKKDISDSEKWNQEEYKKYIIFNFNRIFQYAKQFNLYRNKYEKSGVLDLEVKSLEDIRKIPILEKKEIRKSLSEFEGKYIQNTGGTTGNPLSIFLDKNAREREKAHMHSIWENVGYKRSIARFTFRGRNLGNKSIEYNYYENQYSINIYRDPIDLIDEFFNILSKRNVRYFHGYPSAIYKFLKEIENNITKEQKELIKEKIDCCFFGSEYPTPIIISYARQSWNLDFISWYGHSEMCVLAPSKKNEIKYYPLRTYSYVEAESNMLIGTTYHNFDMPLIRYNTGDLIFPNIDDSGILNSFEIKEGRIGDFIIDKNDKPISLTALIFGRHHEIFNYIDYIQIYQKEKGVATLLIVSLTNQKINAGSLMDLENVKVDFIFKYINKPLRTKSGKISLRIHKLPK